MKKLHFFKLLFCTMLVAAATAFVGCNDEPDTPDTPTLEVSPAALSFEFNGGAKTFNIITTGTWRIVVPESATWLAVTPALEGAGSASITVTVGESKTPNTATLKVNVYTNIAGFDKLIDTKEVKITQSAGGEQPSDELIYGNNFDKEAAVKGDKGWPFLDQFEGWKNQTGTGASTVTYSFVNMSVRQSSKQSGGYDGASSANKIFFGAAPATFDIEKITLPSGKVNYRIVFGAAYAKSNNNVYDNTFKTNMFHVTVGNGTAWSQNLTYTKIGGGDTTDPYWTLFAVDFTLPEAISELSIRFTADEASVFAIDDVKFTEGVGSDQIVKFGGSVEPGETLPITIPAMIAQMTDVQVVLDAANDRVFEAVVVTDKEGGNFNENNLLLMTPGATTEKNGIMLYGSGKYTNPKDSEFTFKAGDKVKVTLKQNLAKIVNYKGQYEATGAKDSDWVLIEKIGTAGLSPIKISVDKLAAFQAMPVAIDNAMAPAAAAIWCAADKFGQHTFTVNGTNMTVFIQANMPGLVGQTFVAGSTGTIIGYATVYQNNAQICPQVVEDVAPFMGAAVPLITKLDPASLAFAAEGETKSVAVTTANAEGCTLEVSADKTNFTATATGLTSISVTATPNTGTAAITGTLTVKLMKNGSAVDTKTVALTSSAPQTGDEETIEADFSVLANYPTDFPKENPNKMVDAKTFTFNGHAYTFAGSTGEGYYMGYGNFSEKTDPYIINGKAGAYIELPAVAGKALQSVMLTTRVGASKAVMVGIYDSANAPVAGGEAIKLEQLEGKLEYTYNLTGTVAGTKYRIYVNSKHNAQFVKLQMTYN